MIFVTIDGNNVVQEPFDDANNNVPDGALPITQAEFAQLREGFDLFKHEGGVLVPNEVAILARDKNRLIEIAAEEALEALIATDRIRIEAMNRTSVDSELALKGVV